MNTTTELAMTKKITSGINIAMINTSEVCVSVVVDRRHGADALASLRGAFEIQ